MITWMMIKPMLRIAAKVVTTILCMVTLLSAYGGRISTDYLTLPGMLTIAMPWLALATFVVGVIWFLTRRLIMGGLCIVTIVAGWGSISTLYPFSTSKHALPGRSTITLMTYNCLHGWDLEDKYEGRNRTLDYIMNSGADIVCLQELVSWDIDMPGRAPGQMDSLMKVYPYRVGSNSVDTKILSKYPVEYIKANRYLSDLPTPQRFSIYRVEIDGKPLTIINMHLCSIRLNDEEKQVVTGIHNIGDVKRSVGTIKGNIRKKMSVAYKKRNDDVRAIREVLEHVDGPVIICGDLNDVAESYAYRKLRSTDLKDARTETTLLPMVTFNRHAFPVGLDHVLYRGDLRALSFKRGDIKSSDHYPLMVQFEF